MTMNKEGEIIKGLVMNNLDFINSSEYESDFTLIVEGINTYKYITSTTLEEQERYAQNYKGEKVNFIMTKIGELYHYIRQLNNKEKNIIYKQMVNEIRGYDPYKIYDEDEELNGE